MKITALDIRDYRGIEDVHIEPGERQIVVIEGANGAGKSSIIHALMAAFAGFSGDGLVRNGADKAEIAVRLAGTLDEQPAEIIVRRTVAAGKPPVLDIRYADGRKISQPTALLKRLTGACFLDPLAFLSQSQDARIQTLLRAVGLGDVLTALADERKAAYDERREINRVADVARKALAGMPVPDPGAPSAPVDVDALLARKRQADDVSAQRSRSAQRSSDLRSERQRVGAEIARLTDRLRAIDAELADVVRAIPPAVELDWTELDQLADAEQLNRRYHEAATARAMRAPREQELTDATAESERLTARIHGIDQRKRRAVAECELPAGIQAVTDDEGAVTGLTWQGVPLDALSDSQRLRVSVAVAAALQPQIHDVFVDRAEALDASGWAALRSLAAEHGLTVWAARVGEGFPDAIVIEEGRVRGATDGQGVLL